MPVVGDTIAFRRSLDVEAAARTFAQHRRARLTDVLEGSSAQRLHACLASEVPWRLVYNEGAKQVVVDEFALERFDPKVRRGVLHQVLTRAQDHFQYIYRSFPMVTAYLNGEYPDLFLHRVFEWLNDAETMAVFRKITGIDSLRKADAQATLYRPGHFLTAHNDSGLDKEHRRVAYVLNVTQSWRAEWGGQLQFLGQDGGVEEVWLPGYNTLALFMVPTQHTVTYVAPFAKQPRYAITGWLCDA